MAAEHSTLAAGLRSLGAEEGGWTLIELLVGAVISLFIAGVAMMVLNTAVRTQPQTSERAAQIQDGRTLVEKISRELRQATRVHSAGPTTLEIQTQVNSNPCGGAFSSTATLCRVVYSCGTTACTRTEREPAATSGGTTKTVATGILGPNVFDYQAGDPPYVGIELKLPDEGGGEAVSFTDGVSLREYQSEQVG
jgi:type II secretory pathway pseudopilin PulG